MNYRKEKGKFKRSLNGQPFNLFIELLVVTDLTVFQDQSTFAQSTDTNIVFTYMKAYFAHYINGVSNYTNKKLISFI